MEAATAVPVSARAVLGRVNRAIKDLGKRVVRTKARSAQRHALGAFYVSETGGIQGGVIETDVDLEQYARRLKVLRANEVMEPLPAAPARAPRSPRVAPPPRQGAVKWERVDFWFRRYIDHPDVNDDEQRMLTQLQAHLYRERE